MVKRRSDLVSFAGGSYRRPLRRTGVPELPLYLPIPRSRGTGTWASGLEWITMTSRLRFLAVSRDSFPTPSLAGAPDLESNASPMASRPPPALISQRLSSSIGAPDWCYPLATTPRGTPDTADVIARAWGPVVTRLTCLVW
ncbi:hypothetical protein ASPFODRAFT_202555 [Aspergillus luchuensis CBS 106.47]|uniref:Uncharacterized protein n=1 Tax=Aspergillus luchuensis (strain CBS 106.47) TaxID=1137211 RepID=A0A1M3U1J4_ASPLC|nr:hypothetical protein ASPFODRAFT_202555 [Aspergillus luchuensis CBS 106.47]